MYTGLSKSRLWSSCPLLVGDRAKPLLTLGSSTSTGVALCGTGALCCLFPFWAFKGLQGPCCGEPAILGSHTTLELHVPLSQLWIGAIREETRQGQLSDSHSHNSSPRTFFSGWLSIDLEATREKHLSHPVISHSQAFVHPHGNQTPDPDPKTPDAHLVNSDVHFQMTD